MTSKQSPLYRVLLAALFSWLLAGCAGQATTSQSLVSDRNTGQDSLAFVSLSAELDALLALSAPDGVEPAIFDALKSKLARVLQATASDALTPAPPDSAGAVVDDLAYTQLETGGAQFSWSYRSPGDYSQDSQVNVSDLTPVGQFYLSQQDDADWPRGQLADGNADGLVNVSDITPIGQNFMNQVEGYIFQSSSDPQSAGWQDIGQTAFGGGTTPAAGGRRQFRYAHANPVQGNWYRVVPFLGGERGIAGESVHFLPTWPVIDSVSPTSGRTGAEVTFSAAVTGSDLSYSWDFGDGAEPGTSTEAEPTVVLGAVGNYIARLTVSNVNGEDERVFTLQVNANQSPVAALSADPASGPPPLAVAFDASASYDADGQIVNYSWDWEGDGSWDLDSGTTPTAEHTYAAEGEYEAVVRVIDDSGAQGTTARMIRAGEGANILIWFAADNELGGVAFDEIQELETLGSTPEYTLLIGYDIDEEFLEEGQTGAEQVRFIKVVQDDDPDAIVVNGDAANLSFSPEGYDSADPEHLNEFLGWAAANFPAVSNTLVLWSHGDGWMPGQSYLDKAASVRTSSGLLNDAADGYWNEATDNTEVLAALTGYYFNVLVLCGCTMCDIESIHELSHSADWIVATEDWYVSDGINFDIVLERALADIPTDYELACSFVDTYMDNYAASTSNVNMAVIDTGAVAALTDSLAGLAGEVTAKAAAERVAFLDADYASLHPSGGTVTRDLADFLSRYRDATTDAAVQGYIDQVLINLGNACPYFRENNVRGFSGVAVFMPRRVNAGNEYLGYYADVPFSAATGWLAMLESIVLLPDPVELSWSAGDKLVIEWDEYDDEFDLVIYDPDGNRGSPIHVDPLPGDVEFSEDSFNSGLTTEWAELLPTAQTGVYKFYIDMAFHSGESQEWYYCNAELQNSSGDVLHDFGAVEFREDDMILLAELSR